MRIIYRNACIINENNRQYADVAINEGRIEKIESQISYPGKYVEIDASGKYLIPGLIDDQVHFREPGLTHKANIFTESRAAIAGGITSFMEMPNTKPPALNMDLLEEKYAIAAATSLANYSFYMGVSNNNADDALRANSHKDKICGIKIFMGSSTGNMLVDNENTLRKLFANSEMIIATHCEDEKVIQANKLKYPQADHARYHPLIRNTDACYASSSYAIALAKEYNTRLHILHITTSKELSLFQNDVPLAQKRITSEVCVHHLTFSDSDYDSKNTLIQCNPAIKSEADRQALWTALLDNRIDVIATDHAPHTYSEKMQPYGTAPSGLPLVQHALLQLLEHAHNGQISIEKIVEKACHAPAMLFQIKDRGYIREGYFADLVLIDPNKKTTVSKDNILYKCGWSPFESVTFQSSIAQTMVNGEIVWDNGKIIDHTKGSRLLFLRD